MKNTLIELAKKSGNGIVNPFGLYIFEESELTKFAELLQANSERADWNCNDIDATNLTSKTLEQFCRDNIRLAPFFAMLASALANSGNAVVNINKTVDNFLAWKLPDDFAPDAGISFTKEIYGHTFQPIGTNLFTAVQAKAMFAQCLSYDNEFNLEYTCKRIRRLLNALDIPDPSNGNDNTLMGCLFSLLGMACSKIESSRASLANKPELRVYIEHDFVCVRTETGQLLASKKLSDFKANEFLAITKG